VITGIGRGTVLMAFAATLTVLGALSVLTGFILLIGDQWLPSDLYWVASLIVLVVSGIIAGVCAKRGTALLSPQQLAPDQTAATLQEDREWLKQRLTSGVTSS
jgi:hypothetical protein